MTGKFGIGFIGAILIGLGIFLVYPPLKSVLPFLSQMSDMVAGIILIVGGLLLSRLK